MLNNEVRFEASSPETSDLVENAGIRDNQERKSTVPLQFAIHGRSSQLKSGRKMVRIQFDGEGENHVSKPVKRMRWASQHITGQNAVRKRMSVIKRFPKRMASAEEKQDQDEALPSASDPEAPAESQPRTVYVNVPVPHDARDENGHVKQHFGRNKIRTSKYTPLSFVPKNLWFQFHNIANVYFLFIIILGVCRPSLLLHGSC